MRDDGTDQPSGCDECERIKVVNAELLAACRAVGRALAEARRVAAARPVGGSASVEAAFHQAAWAAARSALVERVERAAALADRLDGGAA